MRLLRWSNAGYPPPLPIGPHGASAVLARDPDLLLGLDPGTDWHDHTQLLEPGATVVLYTDGLVERRGMPLDDGLDRLVQTGGRLAGRPLEQLCDELLEDLAAQTEDDVALIAIRAHSQHPHRPQVLPREDWSVAPALLSGSA